MVGQVVVGADGSESSTRAIESAAHEAMLRGLRLRIVHAVIWSMVDTPMDLAAMGIPREDLREAAKVILADAEERARMAAPEIEISTHMEIAGAAQALLSEGENADLIVVGNRGHGGFTGLLVGSTAVQVAAHATCPVLVVRPDVPREDPTGPIVVGVDGSPEGRLALRFAITEAKLRGATVRALHALPEGFPPEEGAEALAAAEKLLDTALVEIDAAPGDVSVSAEIVRGQPAEALVEASRTASMIAVGGRGRGGFRGLLFGSVSHALIHHAECSVAIARGAEDEQE
ncbi:universal stress protein [Phytomonospora sp. NPDC050363]|uniref:universal stress protein n=1 Tax=Phytomonospora sp. NPDC050363 TaxID=3155642 RepID=UPI0033C61A88